MRLPCEVIEDLLALYHDDVCSELTKEIVEEHLAQCASCKAKLDLIEEEIHFPQQDYEAVDTLKKIKKKVKIKEIRSILVTVTILVVFMVGFYQLQYKLRPVSTEKMKVTEVARLSDGSVGFKVHMRGKSTFQTVNVIYDTDKKGILYMTPISAVFSDTTKYKKVNCFYNTGKSFTYKSYGGSNSSEEYPAKNIKKIYLGTEKDHVLIWKEGMSLPKASADLEAEYKKE